MRPFSGNESAQDTNKYLKKAQKINVKFVKSNIVKAVCIMNQ